MIYITWISSSEEDSDSLELSESLRPPKNFDMFNLYFESVREHQVECKNYLIYYFKLVLN